MLFMCRPTKLALIFSCARIALLFLLFLKCDEYRRDCFSCADQHKIHLCVLSPSRHPGCLGDKNAMILSVLLAERYFAGGRQEKFECVCRVGSCGLVITLFAMMTSKKATLEERQTAATHYFLYPLERKQDIQIAYYLFKIISKSILRI